MFYFDSFFGKKVLKSTLLKDFDCFFTTRDFVLTPKDRIDLEQQANENRALLTEKTNCKIISSNQVHSSNVKLVDGHTSCYEETDALISNIPNTLLLLNFADCVPIILYSANDNVGSAIHAGWRGTASEIARITAQKMIDEFKIDAKNITALIGPAIGKCCFETHEDVFNQLIKNKNQKELYKKKGDKYFVDLKLLNKYQLQNCGIQNIDMSDYCTCCMSDIFFSYRKENGLTARHSAVIKIKGDN